METVWFVIVAVMIAAYVVLDGFDLGAASSYLIVGRPAATAECCGRSGGLGQDEVWLLAAGGTLYFAYPQLYACSSGYLLMIVLWLLMLQGIGIELRAHMNNPVWRGFFDIFSVSAHSQFSLGALAVSFREHSVPMATSLRPCGRTSPRPPSGILDWFTVTAGIRADHPYGAWCALRQR
jgi:cytochrome d ubiquinol oxidase subunit II